MVSKRIETNRHRSAVDKLDLPDPVSKALKTYGGFEKLVNHLPEHRTLASIAREHDVLSDITRVRIVHALSQSSLCPCLLKRITRVADSRLSYHLKVLEKAGLIRSRRTKSWRVYSITPKGRKTLSP